MFQPLQAGELGCFHLAVLTLESRNLPLWLRKVAEVRCVAYRGAHGWRPRDAIVWSYKKLLHGAMKLKPERKLLKGSVSQTERSVLQSTKLKWVGDWKSILTSEMELQSLEFAQLVLSVALVQYCYNVHFPAFWNDNGYPLPLFAENILCFYWYYKEL